MSAEFGFASALSDTGLPQGNIPLALAVFNIGVEVGQVTFVLVILLFRLGYQSINIQLPRAIQRVPIYIIGSVASYWLIERVIGFWA